MKTREISTTTKLPLLFPSLFLQLAGDETKTLDLSDLVQVPAEALFFDVSRRVLTVESKVLFNSTLLTKTLVKLGQKPKFSSLKNAVEDEAKYKPFFLIKILT